MAGAVMAGLGSGRNRKRSGRVTWSRARRNAAVSAGLATALRRSMPIVRFLTLWLAAWALILQSTLAFNLATATAGAAESGAFSLICHTQDSGDPAHDLLIKKCPKCVLSILGHSLPPPQAHELQARFFAARVVHAGHRPQTPHRDDTHDRPGARAPPVTA